MSHWLDDAASRLSEGRFNRRQVLRRGGAVAAAGLLTSAIKPLAAFSKPCDKCGTDDCLNLLQGCCKVFNSADPRRPFEVRYDRLKEKCCPGVTGSSYQAEDVCKTRQQCCNAEFGAFCCDDDEECCGPDCCDKSHGAECCHSGKFKYCALKGECCPQGQHRCSASYHGKCCSDTLICCGHTCCKPDDCYEGRFCRPEPCPRGQHRVTCGDGVYMCCATGEYCCGGECCKPSNCFDHLCCFSGALDDAHTAQSVGCNDQCCKPGNTCCGTGTTATCCKSGQCANGHCCPTGQTPCGTGTSATCCNPSDCNNGVCSSAYCACPPPLECCGPQTPTRGVCISPPPKGAGCCNDGVPSMLCGSTCCAPQVSECCGPIGAYYCCPT